jgi:hypothetical protein
MDGTVCTVIVLFGFVTDAWDILTLKNLVVRYPFKKKYCQVKNIKLIPVENSYLEHGTIRVP